MTPEHELFLTTIAQTSDDFLPSLLTSHIETLWRKYRQAPVFPMTAEVVHANKLTSFCLSIRRIASNIKKDGLSVLHENGLGDTGVLEALILRLQQWQLTYGSSNTINTPHVDTQEADQTPLALAGLMYHTELMLCEIRARKHGEPGVSSTLAALREGESTEINDNPALFPTIRTFYRLIRCINTSCRPLYTIDTRTTNSTHTRAQILDVWKNKQAELYATVRGLLVRPVMATQWANTWLRELDKQMDTPATAERIPFWGADTMNRMSHVTRPVGLGPISKQDDCILRQTASANTEAVETHVAYHRRMQIQRRLLAPEDDQEKQADTAVTDARDQTDSQIYGASIKGKQLAVLATAVRTTIWLNIQLHLVQSLESVNIQHGELLCIDKARKGVIGFLNEHMSIQPHFKVRSMIITLIYEYNLTGGASQLYRQMRPDYAKEKIAVSSVLEEILHPEHRRMIRSSFNKRDMTTLFKDTTNPFRNIIIFGLFGWFVNTQLQVDWRWLYLVTNYQLMERWEDWLRAQNRGNRVRRPVIVCLFGHWVVYLKKRIYIAKDAFDALAVWCSVVAFHHNNIIEDQDLCIGKVLNVVFKDFDQMDKTASRDLWQRNCECGSSTCVFTQCQ
jgi:hypothetical protein